MDNTIDASTEPLTQDDLAKISPEKRKRVGQLFSDYASHHLPSDKLNGSGTGTGNSMRPSMMDLEYISQFRIGPAFKVAIATPRRALNAGFDFRSVDDDDKVIPRPAIERWMYESDFKNALITAAVYDSIYGIGTVLKRYKGDMREGEMKEEAPNEPPKRFEALNPRVFMPINVTRSRGLDYDEEYWEFVGGRHRVKAVHPSRVEVFRTMPYANDWRGLSSMEPIWLSLLCYMNNLIFLTRGIAKWGNMVPVIHHHTNNPDKAAREAYLTILEEAEKNGAYFIGRDDKLDFSQTKLGTGIESAMNVFRLDISSGSELPMNYLFGLSDSGGIGSGGALTSERTLMNKFSTIQTSYQDDIMNILTKCNFKDLDGIYPKFRLSLQQTQAQELANREAEVRLEMQEIQRDMLKLQYEMMVKQKDWIEENEPILTPEEEAHNLEQATDFTDSQYKVNYEMKLAARKAKMDELMERMRFIRVQNLQAGVSA